jgi:integrase/recombinase XerD
MSGHKEVLVTHLRKMMLEELERRNYTESTTRAYLQIVQDYAGYFHRSPDQLGPEQIREYASYLFRERKLADNTVAQRVAALRFFYTRVLKRAWHIEETPYPKKRKRLPIILSREEVDRLIESALTPFHRTILMTLYGTGSRRAELANLRIADVDSQRMIIHIRGGKGRKDRDVMLGPNLLEELRQHYRRLRRKAGEWLFPGGRWHTADYPIDDKVVWYACRVAAQRAGIDKPMHPHTLRHYLPFWIMSRTGSAA